MKKKVPFILCCIVCLAGAVTMSLFKKKTIVTFMSEPSIVYQKVTVVDGKVDVPSDPILNGYVFDCWMLNDEPYTFDSDITSSLTLVASYKKILSVVFYNDIGDQKELACIEGQALEEIPNPFPMEDYVFVRWTDETGKEFHAEDIITESQMIHAEYQYKVPMEQMMFTKDDFLLKLGEMDAIFVLGAPENWAEEVYYVSDNPDIVSIDEFGQMRTHGVGKTKVTAYSESGISHSANIEVYIPMEKIMVESTELHFPAGSRSLQLSYSVYPENCTYPDVTVHYDSCKDLISISEDGVILKKGNGVGQFTIQSDYDPRILVNIIIYTND